MLFPLFVAFYLLVDHAPLLMWAGFILACLIDIRKEYTDAKREARWRANVLLLLAPGGKKR